MKIYGNSVKSKKIKEYIQRKGKISQATLSKHFFKEFGYSNMVTARVCVSSMLKKLESNKEIYKDKIQEDGRGSIDSNIWRVR
ncbi:MAG: hypothetical protein U9R08_03675 [Nanoarchaeota archaeon]|nr:hypothetical protein [Nanoarchaeota archaeon]